MKAKTAFLIAGFLSMLVALWYCKNNQINYQLHWTSLSIIFYIFSGIAYLEEKIDKK